jgi:hypothetical protein
MDFVVQTGRRRVGLEVRCQAMRHLVLTRSGRAFLDAYRPNALIVVNRWLRHEMKEGGTRVFFVPAHRADLLVGAVAGE